MIYKSTSMHIKGAALMGFLAVLPAYAQEPEAAPPTAEVAVQPPAAATTPTFEDERAPIGSFGLGIGTSGVVADYAYALNRWVDLRVGFDFGSPSHSDKESGIDYHAKLKLSAVSGKVEIKPFGGGFRLVAGLYSKAPELHLKASGEDDYDIGDRTYNGDLHIKGNADLGSAAPYLGLGWGGTANSRGFGVSFDAGVMFADKPKFKLAATGMACDATDDETCDPNGPTGFDVTDTTGPNGAMAQVFQDDLEQERKDDEHDAKDFHYWPVLNVALHYRF